jgi:hypothetical protein
MNNRGESKINQSIIQYPSPPSLPPHLTRPEGEKMSTCKVCSAYIGNKCGYCGITLNLCAEHDREKLREHGDICWLCDSNDAEVEQEYVGGKFTQHITEIEAASTDVPGRLISQHISDEEYERFFNGIMFRSLSQQAFNNLLPQKGVIVPGVYLNRRNGVVYLLGRHDQPGTEKTNFDISVSHLRDIIQKGQPLSVMRHKHRHVEEGTSGEHFAEYVQVLPMLDDPTLPPSKTVLRLVAMDARMKMNMEKPKEVESMEAWNRIKLENVIQYIRPVWERVDLGRTLESDHIIYRKDMNTLLKQMDMIPDYFLSQCRRFTFDPKWLFPLLITYKEQTPELQWASVREWPDPSLEKYVLFAKIMKKLVGLQELIIGEEAFGFMNYAQATTYLKVLDYVMLHGVKKLLLHRPQTLLSLSFSHKVVSDAIKPYFHEFLARPDCMLKQLTATDSHLSVIPKTVRSLTVHDISEYEDRGNISALYNYIVHEHSSVNLEVLTVQDIDVDLFNALIGKCQKLKRLVIQSKTNVVNEELLSDTDLPPEITQIKGSSFVALVNSLLRPSNLNVVNNLTHLIFSTDEDVDPIKLPNMPSLVCLDCRPVIDDWLSIIPDKAPLLKDLALKISHPPAPDTMSTIAGKLPSEMRFLRVRFETMLDDIPPDDVHHYSLFMSALCGEHTKTIVVESENMKMAIMLRILANIPHCDNVTSLKIKSLSNEVSPYSQDDVEAIIKNFPALTTLSLPMTKKWHSSWGSPQIREPGPLVYRNFGKLHLLELTHVVTDYGILTGYPSALRVVMVPKDDTFAPIENEDFDRNDRISISVYNLLSECPTITSTVLLLEPKANSNSPLRFHFSKRVSRLKMRIIAGRDAKDIAKNYLSVFNIFPQ